MALNRSFLFAPGNHPRRVEKAFTLGAAAVQVDGKMVDYPVVRQAERLLESVGTSGLA